ncbi:MULTISPECIES: peptide-methionine (S)-S-oxide reductase MsrA [Bacillaceae]|uniref:peptide-methionine (S)-S-oxide reductase MsrA n=1 Tax=Bacillaceae TaxID=186817 RepID=UPI000B9C0FBE|nr:peptide-methionine (S)-S-oxide reductase MsrA [Bacillus infantis]MCA1035211.1 peptide-methionine (S)-S-oxide reductase MsrA [Bacillus infantis]MDW2877872.1 peptide-methionine (S)-S-oxide reductase MsrA [Bacillus infantis]OXT18273.1 peptide-methionine (S)-S-oxide reductase [Bacillus sp. OG2]
MTERKELATFAGGCFWCMVKPFDQFDGIHSIISGYTGGHAANPTYEDVKKGDSGHYEVVQIEFDPEVFPYENLLELFWQQIDPTDEGGQFHDRGDQYRTAVFYHNETQRDKAIAARNKLAESGKFSKPIVTKVLPAETFYPAEDYHQDYYKKNSAHYKEDREKSGRDKFIKEHWEK